MGSGESAGVVFPAAADGRRSTSAVGRAVVADALRAVDPAGALGAEHETNWRSGYLVHFRRLIEAGLASKQAWLAIARDGLGSLHARMRVAAPGGDEADLGSLLTAPARQRFVTATVHGTGEAEDEFSLPYHGERLRGDALARKLDAWVTAGIVEPTCADAIRAVAAHPEWLSLPGQMVAVLGAGAEIGPLPILLGWGATVAGVDLPRPALWERVLRTAQDSGGTLLVPVAALPPSHDAAGQRGTGDAGGEGGGETLQERSGLDLVGDVAAAADWLAGIGGPLVLGNYVYADGAANVRVAVAVDALTVRLQAARDDLALAFLATPTDVYAVGADAVEQSVSAYASRSRGAKLAGRRCGHCPAGGCCAAPTCRVPTPGSTTAWSPSRAPTTPWPNGCSAGGPRSPVTAGPQCRSTSPRRRAPSRSCRTGFWRRRTRARTGSASRYSSPPPARC